MAIVSKEIYNALENSSCLEKGSLSRIFQYFKFKEFFFRKDHSDSDTKNMHTMSK